jgi:hypothetical protein
MDLTKKLPTESQQSRWNKDWIGLEDRVIQALEERVN